MQPYFLECLTIEEAFQQQKYLINAAKPSDGSTHLHQRGCLNRTVEAMVVANAK
jgi:hypothetical protein